MLSVRQRIALWFVGLSTFVYVTPTVLGSIFFYYSLTNAIDHELKTLASSLGHAINLENNRAQFRNWARVVQTDPSRSLSTIQLYDANGALLEQYGAEGIVGLTTDSKEIHDKQHSMRVLSTPLRSNGAIVGYLQIEASTKQRDQATRQFAWTMALIAPAVLIGLGICSYFVSDKAMVPIQETIKMLRQFMADASHELNTPLSIINACNEALQSKLAKRDLVFEENEILSSSADRMQRIIDDLMLLAELQNNVEPYRTKSLLSLD